ncbi:hypothetical protein, conserved [Plasmodium gonderi]|uniref:Uncharacterized protein n=1 Tax=Plasmodium gonderi TaxID=77519 RepID=A0A1Y1JNF7_PLAGO|nr:hypothetical protein, conserved [Plasmodium gonderi]GAW81584.1 hypothetical protein, conserved [Plasmodium gonderi]
MNGFRANTNSKKWKYFNNRRNTTRNDKNGRFRGNNENSKRKETKNVEEIVEYLNNISYILNEKYEKYFVYELKEENLKKGNKCFGAINLNYSYNLEDDICILIKIKDEIENNEKELINQRKCSKIMEKIIYYCFFLLKCNEKDMKNNEISARGNEISTRSNEISTRSNEISIQCLEIYNHFLHVVCSDYLHLATSSYGSHFVQTVICVYTFFKKFEEKYIDEMKNRNRNYQEMCIYFKEICNVTTENIFPLMLHKSGTHVLRSFMYSLCGYLNISISNISFRKSKIRSTNTRTELKYMDKGYAGNCRSNTSGDNAMLYEYMNIIVQKVTEEIVNPRVSLSAKNLLYQYVFYDEMEISHAGDGSGGSDANGRSDGNGRSDAHDVCKDSSHNEKERKTFGENKYIMESLSQHLIPPLLYNTYSVPALGTLFELLREKNIECNKLLSEILLIDKTKKYFINQARENCKCYEESPLKQMLSILIKLDGPSIMIEKMLKMNSEPIFYVFNVYILKNINSLVCDNAYSNLVMNNYLTLEYITEEMFDLLIKNIDIDMIIRRKKFNVLRGLFDLSQFYKRNCKLLLNKLLRWLQVDGTAIGSTSGATNSGWKFLWICILCMRRHEDLHPILRDMFNEERKKLSIEEHQIDKSNLNNYNFYDYIKIDTNGYYIMTHILSFPRDSITPVTNSFKQFCNFLKIVNTNRASEKDIEKYNNFVQMFTETHDGGGEGRGGADNPTQEEGEKDVNTESKEKVVVGWRNNAWPDQTRSGGKSTANDVRKKVKPFVRKNTELRGNILLYFCCDKNLSILCEKIAHTFNLINEKYLRNFILIFRNEYGKIASHYIGAHTVVTFFKLGSDDIKKNILDALVENDITVYNSYIKNFMKLKEYKKTKTISTNSKKYLKAKEMFKDILTTSKERDEREEEEKVVGKVKSVQTVESHTRDSENEEAAEEEIEEEEKEEKEVNEEEEKEEKEVNEEEEKEEEEKEEEEIEEEEEVNEEEKEEENEKKEDPEDMEDEGGFHEDYKVASSDETRSADWLGKENFHQDGEGQNDSKDSRVGDEGYMNLITDFIKNSKKKNRKRKKEKEKIDHVLGKIAKYS